MEEDLKRDSEMNETKPSSRFNSGKNLSVCNVWDVPKGGHGGHVACNVVYGQSPQRGPGAEPWWGQEPLKLKAVCPFS